MVQGQTRVEHRVPVVEAGAGIEQLRLPVIHLSRQVPSQLQIAVNHQVDDAQHQIGRTGRQFDTRGAKFIAAGIE